MASVAVDIAPEGNLSRYLREIRKFPMLSSEEEFALSRRWRDDEDVEAAHKLVTSHLRLVAKIAMGYRGYGLPVGDLISEGNVGMMQAVKRFDPDRGFRLATYAMWWIRAAIQEYILHSWSLVKMGTTAAQKKLFFNLRRLKGQMHAMDDGDLQPEQVAKIARTLDVPEQDVVSMNRRLAAPDHSLNAPVRQDSEGEWQDWLVDETESQETSIADREELTGRKALLSSALKTLNERERHILIERRLKDDPTTLEDLSRQYGISRERVRQIEVRVVGKLQKAMKAQIAARARHVSHPKALLPHAMSPRAGLTARLRPLQRGVLAAAGGSVVACQGLLRASRLRSLPTPRAERMAGPVRAAHAGTAGDFGVGRIRCIAGITKLHRRSEQLRRTCGHPRTRPSDDAVGAFRRSRGATGEVELALSTLTDGGDRLKWVGLLDDEYVAILSNDHPVAAETDLPIETFAALPYITITTGGDDTHFIDDALAERGLARLVSAKVPLHSLILMLIGSKALAVVPRWVAVDLVGVCPLAMRPLPFPPPRVAPSMIWHRRLDNDAAHLWLRGTVRPAVTGN